MSLRCFVGLELPNAVSEALMRAGEAFRASVPSWAGEKWVPRDNLHVTTRFIGQVDEASLDELVASLGPAVEAFPAFALTPGRIVARPRAARTSLVWAGFEDDTGIAGDLASRVAETAIPFGADPPARDYQAHVTLCRSRRPKRVSAEALEAANTSFACVVRPMSVVSATLFSSRLTPLGPVYERLAVWHLTGANRT